MYECSAPVMCGDSAPTTFLNWLIFVLLAQILHMTIFRFSFPTAMHHVSLSSTVIFEDTVFLNLLKGLIGRKWPDTTRIWTCEIELKTSKRQAVSHRLPSHNLFWPLKLAAFSTPYTTWLHLKWETKLIFSTNSLKLTAAQLTVKSKKFNPCCAAAPTYSYVRCDKYRTCNLDVIQMILLRSIPDVDCLLKSNQFLHVMRQIFDKILAKIQTYEIDGKTDRQRAPET